MEVAALNPTKILYVITKATWGGAQRYVYDLITEAKKRGFETGLAYGEPGLLSERVSQLDIPVYPVAGLGRDISVISDTIAFSELTELFEQQKPDIVHLNSSKVGFIGALAARRAKIAQIFFTAHGWAFTEPRNIISKAVFFVLHYLTVLLSTTTIANSKATASYAKYWPGTEKKMRTVPLGISPIEFLPRDVARSQLLAYDASLAPTKDTLWIGTIAELHKNKGIDIGIDAWKEANVRGTQWIVMGGGEQHKRLEGQASNTSGIHLLGFVPDASKYLKAFDMFLLPSRTESLGYVLLEAGLAELACIGSDVGGIPEILGNGCGILFKKGDADELKDALLSLASDSHKRSELGQKLAGHVRNDFSLQKMLEETFTLYKS